MNSYEAQMGTKHKWEY